MLVTVNQIKDGMELSVPIMNKFDQLLLPEGTKLHEKHKKLLKTWGIQSVQVNEDTGGSSDWEYDKKKSIEAKETLFNRMAWKPRNVMEEGLYEMALIKLMEKDN